MPLTGLMTTDGVPVAALYNEFQTTLDMYNQRLSDSFLSVFCNRTTKRTVSVSQSTLTMRRTNTGPVRPPVDQLDKRNYTLPDSVPYEVGTGFTRKAIEAGLDSSEMRDAFADALIADEHLIQQIVLKSILNEGGMWDGTMTLAPPRFLAHTFLTSHTHYHAWNATGAPTFDHISTLKQDVVEHGYGRRGLIGMWNSATAEGWARLAEPVQANLWPSTMMDLLQRMGIAPEAAIQIDGVIMTSNEWIPDDYIIVGDPTVKPCYWKDPDGLGTSAQLITESISDFVEETRFLRRWGAAKVTKQGAFSLGYLGGTSWVDYTGWTMD